MSDRSLADVDIMAVAHHAPASPAAVGDTHPELYTTCATLIIAIVVVVYFEERGNHGRSKIMM